MAEKETLPHQPQRSFRAEDELWEAALKKARDEDMTLSQVIRRFLMEYVKPAKQKRAPKKAAEEKSEEESEEEMDEAKVEEAAHA